MDACLQALRVLAVPTLQEVVFWRGARFVTTLQAELLDKHIPALWLIGSYMANDADRMALYKYNLYNGLRTADDYLWLYNENMNRGTRDVPAGLEEATQEVTALIAAGKPLGFEMDASIAKERSAFDRRVECWGSITVENDAPIAGASVLSGISADDGSESDCGIYNINSFGCTVPIGWSGVFTPVLEGYRFEPDSIMIDRASQAQGLWFTAIRQ